MNASRPMDDVINDPVESSRERWARRACGTLAVAGGASGLVTSFTGVSELSLALAFAIWLMFVGFYAAGVWIGLRLIENEPGTWRLLKAYMWVQVPVVQTYAFTYFFGSLLSFSWVYGGGVTFRSVYGPASGWTLALFTEQPAFGIGINAVPACVLLALTLVRQPGMTASLSRPSSTR
jgi:hypothetical protein